MVFGRKGMSGESKAAVAIFIIFAVIFLVTFIMSYFTGANGPPSGPDAVIKYYDDLLKGEYNGNKYSPAALVVAFFIPLISTFAILWSLIRLLPLFSGRWGHYGADNKNAAVVLAMGLSIYIVPTMSWAIMQVFPPLLGVSTIFIAIAVFAIALLIMVSTFFEFGGLKWGGGGGGGVTTPLGGTPLVGTPMPVPSGFVPTQPGLVPANNGALQNLRNIPIP